MNSNLFFFLTMTAQSLIFCIQRILVGYCFIEGKYAYVWKRLTVIQYIRFQSYRVCLPCNHRYPNNIRKPHEKISHLRAKSKDVHLIHHRGNMGLCNHHDNLKSINALNYRIKQLNRDVAVRIEYAVPSKYHDSV